MSKIRIIYTVICGSGSTDARMLANWPRSHSFESPLRQTFIWQSTWNPRLMQPGNILGSLIIVHIVFLAVWRCRDSSGSSRGCVYHHESRICWPHGAARICESSLPTCCSHCSRFAADMWDYAVFRRFSIGKGRFKCESIILFRSESLYLNLLDIVKYWQKYVKVNHTIDNFHAYMCIGCNTPPPPFFKQVSTQWVVWSI